MSTPRLRCYSIRSALLSLQLNKAKHITILDIVSVFVLLTVHSNPRRRPCLRKSRNRPIQMVNFNCLPYSSLPFPNFSQYLTISSTYQDYHSEHAHPIFSFGTSHSPCPIFSRTVYNATRTRPRKIWNEEIKAYDEVIISTIKTLITIKNCRQLMMGQVLVDDCLLVLENYQKPGSITLPKDMTFQKQKSTRKTISVPNFDWRKLNKCIENLQVLRKQPRPLWLPIKPPFFSACRTI